MVCCFKNVCLICSYDSKEKKQNKKAPEDPSDVFSEVLKNVKTFLAVIVSLSV